MQIKNNIKKTMMFLIKINLSLWFVVIVGGFIADKNGYVLRSWIDTFCVINFICLISNGILNSFINKSPFIL